MPINKTSKIGKAGNPSGTEHQISMMPTAQADAPSAEEAPLGSTHQPNSGNRSTLLSRRGFLYGAAAVGAVAAVAAGAAVLNRSEHDEEEVTTLEVPEDHVVELDDCTEANPDTVFRLIGDFTLPYGSLVWANDEAVAACLLPTETPSPLTQVALLNLGTGEYTPMMERSVGADEGFEIYDVRATRFGMVWTEANVFENRWRVYAAMLDENYVLGTPQLLEEGDQATETPSIAAAGESAFWQVMPHIENEEARTEPFVVKQARFGSSDAAVVHQSKGRATAPLYACSDGVCASPRIASGERYWELVHILESTQEADGRITLPGGMQPSAVAWGSTGFSFCFDSIYDYGDGISNLGTYTPCNTHDDLSESLWFHFGRTPFASPAWCGQQWLLVKSTQAVCAIDVQSREYCALSVDDNSDDWGDYLASSGTHSTFVTFSHLDGTDSYGTETHRTQVRVWEPYSDDERAMLEAEAQANEEAMDA